MRGKKGPGSFSLVVLALAVAATVGISLSQRAGADGVHPIAEAARQITTSSDPARLFENPQAAVDPTNPERVAVAVGDVRNGGCMLYISNDGGSRSPRAARHCCRRINSSAARCRATATSRRASPATAACTSQ